MSQYQFALQPFASNNLIFELQITGKITRADNNLNLNYQLTGDLSKIAIPAIADKPIRKDELWQTTCLEFFLGIENSTQYWEFNLAPSKHWNIYRFRDYRQNMTEETAFNSLPFTIQKHPQSLDLSLQLNLNPIISPNQKLTTAISAVIQSDRKITYWALTHPGSKADFHRRDSFIINL